MPRVPDFSPPYLVFLGDARDQLAAKMGVACVQWRPDWCIGQLRLPGCKADARIPDRTIAEAKALGAKTLVLGVVASGGRLQESWITTIVAALESGLDVVSGMHQKLADDPRLVDAARRHGRRLFDIRHAGRSFDTGTGARRRGKRLLTVGTDCSCGKMFTTLAIEAELKRRGVRCTFRATGQTGILIAGSGIAVDAVVSDFVAGAVETLAPANDADHWDLIEGQGSLFHPAFAGVTLGLLHGAQPDVIVLCHEAGRPHIRHLPHQRLPLLKEAIDVNLLLGRVTNPEIRCIGVSLNTSSLSPADAERALVEAARETGLPAVDPMRQGVGALIDRLG